MGANRTGVAVGVFQVTDAEITVALMQAGGVVSEAARLLSYSSWDLKRRIDKEPSLQEVRDNAREGMVDVAESIMFHNINAIRKAQLEDESGNLVSDSSDARWILSRLGKERGYIERRENSGPDGTPIPIAVVKMDLDEL